MSQMDCFLRIDGVDGESTDARHRGEILLQSWSFGTSNPAPPTSGGSGAGVGKVTVRDLVVTKAVDKSSVRLFVASCTGEHFKTATLTCRKAGGDAIEFLTIALSNVSITIYELAASSDGALPVERVALAFTRLVMSETPQTATGALGTAIVGGWDMLTNRKV